MQLTLGRVYKRKPYTQSKRSFPMDLQTLAARYWMTEPAVHANQGPIESSMQERRQHNRLRRESESEKGRSPYINLNTNRSAV